MNSWGNVYYLKSNTEISDIWDCLKEIFKDFGLPEKFPKNFSYENNDEVIYWSIFKENSSLVEFCYTKTYEDKRNVLRIVFDNDIEKVETGNVHTLFYKEIVENAELFFVWKFFPLIKKFVPKSYLNIKITDDKLEKEKFFLKEAKNFNDLLNFSLENVGLSPIIPNVQFFANENGDFFFLKEWIEKFANDLWFTNSEFKKYYGFLPHLNRVNFLKKKFKVKES